MDPVRTIPMEDFFRKPEKVSFELSPDGDALAYLAPWKRRLNLHVLDLDSGEVTRLTSAEERDLMGFTWVGEHRLLYAQDRGGDENYRLYAVDHDGANPADLTPFDEVQCRIVDELEDVDGEILFAMNKREAQIFDVYRLQTDTGAMDMVVENPGDHESWCADHDGKLRVAVTTDGVNKALLYRETEDADWREIGHYTFKETVEPLLFTFDNRALYVSSNVGRDRSVICELDLATGKEGQVHFEHPEVDVGDILWSRKRRTLVGVDYEVDKPGLHFFDEQRRELQAFVDAELPETVNRLVSHSRDETWFVVEARSDRHRGTCYLLDGEARRIEKLFDEAPWLDSAEMAPMQPVRYQARDGRAVRGYLTLPVGREPRGLPAVVNPHGGPWARDAWRFNPEIQFLANRGYAVLQMNFRASTGFGREHLEAGFGQWGLAMQDDITDAVQWAVAEGYVDPARIAIYGASYGGYAALSGLTKTPELYACGVSYVGVSNVFTWLEAFPPYWKPYLEMVYEMVGHPEEDAERLRATSPFFQVDRIRAPLLVAQGANDPRVKQEESDQIVAALRERGVPVEYLVKENEGHGFANEENRFDFYGALEAFLQEHVPAR